jgi:hypothetical protein
MKAPHIYGAFVVTGGRGLEDPSSGYVKGGAKTIPLGVFKVNNDAG